ncbi:hypothetical protein ZHAS_00008529 [Anopheles sinensis]|uniref:Uncharacterized protein n=1 Tax=Anopheles sinensis TaxID=74873 RepID=A0A084VSY0_ANOSI|nr:hypothetical protein ZHAS_00008529 [Anopheles sinensis]
MASVAAFPLRESSIPLNRFGIRPRRSPLINWITQKRLKRAGETLLRWIETSKPATDSRLESQGASVIK